MNVPQRLTLVRKGIFFSPPSTTGRWHNVTGHKSQIPAEVMSAPFASCVIAAHREDTQARGHVSFRTRNKLNHPQTSNGRCAQERVHACNVRVQCTITPLSAKPEPFGSPCVNSWRGDISPQALDVPQKGGNINCLLFIMLLVGVVELVQIVSEELTWITKSTHEKLYSANWSHHGPSLLGSSC